MSEIVFVGTGDAFGAGGRRQSAILLRAPSGSALVDCGATTVSGLSELGIERNEIDTIAVSHFHADHCAGIPILLLAALYEDERKHPLHVVGPPGIEQQVRSLASAMCYAIEDRDWSFRVDFREFRAGQSLEAGPVGIEAFEALHQPHTQPHGMIVRAGSRRVAYSGDTGWFEALPRHVGNADLFICECTYHDNDFAYHLNHEDLVAHKHEFDCHRIVLTHLGTEMAHRRGQAAFETADDGTVIQV